MDRYVLDFACILLDILWYNVIVNLVFIIYLSIM